MRMRFLTNLRDIFTKVCPWIGNRLAVNYTPLSTATSSGHHLSRSRSYLLRPELAFICGLPLSILLLYTDSFVGLILAFGLLYWVVCFVFYLIEQSLVYVTNEPQHSRLLCDTPSKYNFSSWESVDLHPDGKSGPLITGYIILHENPVTRSSCPTIFIMHGNAGNIGHRLPLCRLLYDHFPCNILIIDYRGFGKSTGVPSEEGLYSDVRCSLEYLLNRRDIAPDKIFLFGRSLGGALAIHLGLTAKSVRGVIVENTFTSLPATAQHMFGGSFTGFMQYILPAWMFSNKYSSLEHLRLSTSRESTLPKFLFISGGADELLPPKMMQDLASVYQPCCSLPVHPNPTDPVAFMQNGADGLVVFPEGRHNTTWLCPDWANVIHHFIQKTCSSSLSV